MSVISEICAYVQKGKSKIVKNLVKQALEEGLDAKVILEDGLTMGMKLLGDQFKRNEVFVPEVLIGARAMNIGLAVLEHSLVEFENPPIGKVVMGTVKGDLHDIGKNLVTVMLKSAGFEVHDLGVDVEPEDFIDKAEEVGADIIGISALLTTTMVNMKKVMELLEARGLRDKYIVMIGGAPVTERFARDIGADYYTPDAASAADVAKEAIL